MYLDSPCAYVKLLLHKCHPNEPNIFSQVGLIAINIFGEALGSQGKQNPEKQHFQELEYESQFDKETLDRLRVLMKAKERAEMQEDYGEAKKLHNAITDLKRVGIQLQKLEERKNIAVKENDYDSALTLKNVYIESKIKGN